MNYDDYLEEPFYSHGSFCVCRDCVTQINDVIFVTESGEEKDVS